MDLVPYFAYGTTRQGFANHRRYADLLGERVARVRTASAHAVVVPHRAACSNPGCPYLHRMAALVAGFEPLRVEGDLFLITASALAVVDRLETGSPGLVGPYVRERLDVVALDGAETYAAQGYLARERGRWRALVRAGRRGGAGRVSARPCGGRTPQGLLRAAPRPCAAARRHRSARRGHRSGGRTADVVDGQKCSWGWRRAGRAFVCLASARSPAPLVRSSSVRRRSPGRRGHGAAGRGRADLGPIALL